MTPKERFYARLGGSPADRPPNMCILMAFAARHAGRPMDAFCKDHRVLVEANLRAASDFGIDVLSTMSDPYRETADYGAPISFPPDRLPVCPPMVKGPEDMKGLRPFKIEDSVRMLDRLRAVEAFAREGGSEWPVMGWVEGPLAECADLMGLTPLIYALYDEPGMVREMLGICLESALACARAQARAGADVIGVGDAVASVLGPAVYREFALPYEQRLFEAIASEGAVGRLHICGDIAPLLADIRRSGARVVDVDWMVGFGEARAALEGAAVVCGNFDPVRVVRDGTPEDVGRAVRGCLVEGGGQCLVMAGCEIPQDTPPENLAAVGRALGWAPHAPWPL